MLQPKSTSSVLFLHVANMVYDSSQTGVHTFSVNKLEPDDVYYVPDEAPALDASIKSTAGSKVEFTESFSIVL